MRTRGSVETCRSLDIGGLNRAGILVVGWTGSWIWSCDGKETARIGISVRGGSLQLSYRYRKNGSEWEPVDQRVPVVWRPCRFGGRRPYFRCCGVVNGLECNRTVTRIYGADKFFLCRHCYRLSYGSQHEDRWDRALRRANKIRTRLGGEPGLASIFPRRPKRVRHATYERLRDAVIEAECEAEERIEILAAKLMRIDVKLGRRSTKRRGRFWK